MGQSKYHLGFKSLERETSVGQLPVRGHVPSWLAGTLVRTAPAKFEVGSNTYNHWFDGLAMLHSFSFSAGRVSYANRFLRSRSYLEAIQTGRISRGEFGTDPCRTLFGRIAAFFKPKLADNANVSINKLADEVVAFPETPLPIRFDASTLETLGVFEYRATCAASYPPLILISTFAGGAATIMCSSSAAAANTASSALAGMRVARM